MRTVGARKITLGWVEQIYDKTGNCIEQAFTAGDQVDWEDEEGTAIDEPDNVVYQPMEMSQPGQGLGDLHWHCPTENCDQTLLTPVNDLNDVLSLMQGGEPMCVDCDCEMLL